jgi:hypothetical protein
MNYYKIALENKTMDQLFDVLSGFYSLTDSGYRIETKHRDAAIAAVEMLQDKFGAKSLDSEIGTINEIFEEQ